MTRRVRHIRRSSLSHFQGTVFRPMDRLIKARASAERATSARVKLSGAIAAHFATIARPPHQEPRRIRSDHDSRHDDRSPAFLPGAVKTHRQNGFPAGAGGAPPPRRHGERSSRAPVRR